MTEFWKNYPAQNRDTPVICYRRCAALIHAEMSKRLDSEACSYYCARQDVAFFDVESITRFARGPGNNYGFKEATAQTVIREMFAVEMLVTKRVRVIDGNPFYDTPVLQKQVTSIMEQCRPPVIKTAAVIMKSATRPGGKSSDGCRDIIHPPTRQTLTAVHIKIVKPVKGHPHVATILDTRSLQKLENPVTDGWGRQPIGINPSPPPTQSPSFGDMAKLTGYSNKVLLFGKGDCPIVNGVLLAKPLSTRKFMIVEALLQRFPEGLVISDLDKAIKAQGGHKELRELVNTEPWHDVIVLPGKVGRGGARIL
jgi:hypothetical protein